MGYSINEISNATISPFEGGIVVRANVGVSGMVAQCYVSGTLAAYQSPRQGSIEFVLPELSPTDLLFLLMVDQADAGRDYFAEEFPIDHTHGNRITVNLPQLMSYLPGDRWRVYLGRAGELVADELVVDKEFYHGCRKCCGFGMDSGSDFGFDASACGGLGLNFGLGEFGFDCEMLSFTSQVLPPGDYPVKVEVIDRYGNASTPSEAVISLITCPRPSREPTVTLFNQSTDTLELTWTPSEDI